MEVPKRALLFCLTALLTCSAAVYALPVIVNDFANDPSGREFQIVPIGPGEGATNNIAGLPELIYGVTDPVSGTANTMQMNWQPIPGNEYEPAQAGWALELLLDPDLTNQQIILSINPPGVAAPQGPPGGMTHVEVHIIDVNGVSAGGWGFNTDQATSTFPGPPWVPLANDFALSGQAPVFPLLGPPPPPPPIPPPPWASLAQNWMQTVTINVGIAPAAGSANITGGPLGPLVGPNYLIASAGGDLTKITRLEFYENGVLAGGQSVPVGQQPGLSNYWDHVIVTPEPATVALLSLGALALIRRRRSR